jgi:3-dehydroquinate synthase
MFFSNLLSAIQKPYSRLVLISDSHVYQLYGDEIVNLLKSWPLTIILIPPGESSKTIDTAKKCWEEMYRDCVDRQSLVIGFGGGVVTDLAGFVAACYMRGLDVIHIPTTLMGMVDAAIGGKSGVNLSEGKNIVGSFHSPQQVIISSSFLKTLPEREFRAGFAEIVKYAIIDDPELFEILENEANVLFTRNNTLLDSIIQRCSKIKREIVEQDEKDQGRRAVLNLGHTFAHALEAATHYTTYLHGEAVAIGLSCAFYTSWLPGYIEESLLARLHALLEKLQLPLALPPEISLHQLIDFMKRDKKTMHGKIHLILVKKIGHVEKIQVDQQLIQNALETKMKRENNDSLMFSLEKGEKNLE